MLETSAWCQPAWQRAWADRAPCVSHPHFSLMPSLKAITLTLWGVSCPSHQPGIRQKTLYFPSAQPSISRLALLCEDKWTQVCFGNKVKGCWALFFPSLSLFLWFFSFFLYAVHILKSEATYRTHTSSWGLLCSSLFLDTPWASERDQHVLFYIHWNLSITLDALNQEFIHFCNPCHHLITIWSLPYNRCSIFP